MIDLITEQLRNNQITAIEALEQAAGHTNAESLLRDAAFKMADQCELLEEEIKAVRAELKTLQDSDDDAYNRGWNTALLRISETVSAVCKDIRK